MRRLLVFISVVVFVDTMLFGVMIPLLPGYADAYGLGKLEAGLLFGAYGAGAVLGGIPGGILASRIGPRRAVLAGLVLLALASFGFALAASPHTLELARFVQGLSSTMTWAGALAWVATAAPRARRGQTLGIVFGAAVAGAITGPMFGALAKSVSIEASFAVVGVVGLALGTVAGLQPEAPPDRTHGGRWQVALADRAFLGGLWLSTLPAFFFGVLDVLLPLDLHDAGYSAFAIGSLFVIAGLAEIVVGPFAGRVSDTRGRTFPVRIGLAVSVVAAVVLGIVSSPVAAMAIAVVATVSFSSLYAPGMALISDRAEVTGLAMALAFGLMNSSWALGVVLGPVIGGALAQAFDDSVPYALCALLAALTLVALRRRSRRSVVTDRVA